MVCPTRMLASGLVTAAVILAQEVPPPPPFAATVASWLDAATADRELLARATAELLADEAAALAWLAPRLTADAVGVDGRRRARMLELASNVLLAVIDQRRQSGIVHRGQYEALRALQPFATQRLFELLLQTPDWFAETRRVHLVAAIADLQVQPPSPPVLLGITDLIGEVESEPDDLRLALACLVWQWGRREPVEKRADRLRAESAEGDAEDRILALRQLADLWYRVGEYAKAANSHAAMVSLASSNDLPLSPTDRYWGACYWSLCDRVAEGLASLRACADLLASPTLDSSHRLPRKLFELDPDIARLRADPQFQAIFERAFGSAEPPTKDR